MAMVERAKHTVAVISIFSVLATVCMTLRLWTRFTITRAPGWEDWVLLVSWLCATATVIAVGLQIPNGLGEHVQALPLDKVQRLMFHLYWSIISYCASLNLTKIALLLQYRRVFPTRRFQTVCLACIAILAAFTVVNVILAIAPCLPISTFWTFDPNGKCIEKFASFLSNTIFNIVTDLIIIGLPMPLVSRLHLPPRQKWLLVGVFLLGGAVCIISIVRLHSLIVISRSTDPTFDNAPAAMFSIVEIQVAIVCVCLPTLRPCLARWVPSLGSSSREASDPSVRQRSRFLSSGLREILQLQSTRDEQRGVIMLKETSCEANGDIGVVIEPDTTGRPNGRDNSTEYLF